MIILVTKDVSESKRRRIEKNGATVLEIEEMTAGVAIGEPHYAQVLSDCG